MDFWTKQKARSALPFSDKTGRTDVRGTTCIRAEARTLPAENCRIPITEDHRCRLLARRFSGKLRDDLGGTSRELSPAAPSLGIGQPLTASHHRCLLCHSSIGDTGTFVKRVSPVKCSRQCCFIEKRACSFTETGSFTTYIVGSARHTLLLSSSEKDKERIAAGTIVKILQIGNGKVLFVGRYLIYQQAGT